MRHMVRQRPMMMKLVGRGGEAGSLWEVGERGQEAAFPR